MNVYNENCRYKVLWVWEFNGEEFFVDGIDEVGGVSSFIGKCSELQLVSYFFFPNAR